MILTKEVKMCLTNRNRKFYLEKGYDVINKNYCYIKIEDISTFSHIKIDVKCEFCQKEKSIKFFKYWKNKNNYGKYSCSNKCSMVKNEKTCLSKYNVSHQNKVKEFYNKGIETKIKKGLIEIYNSNDYFQYRRMANNITDRNKSKLMEIWNGYDYYDNEYIIPYYSLNSNNPLYPSIDHKISVLYGFNNKIPVEDISDIKNLCLTKRRLNSLKGTLSEELFKQKIQLFL